MIVYLVVMIESNVTVFHSKIRQFSSARNHTCLKFSRCFQQRSVITWDILQTRQTMMNIELYLHSAVSLFSWNNIGFICLMLLAFTDTIASYGRTCIQNKNGQLGKTLFQPDDSTYLTHMLLGEPPLLQFYCWRNYENGSMDCSDLNISDMSNLKCDVAVSTLDFSCNRIRELKNNTFESCISIKFLHLQANSIYRIESHTFQPLSDLEVLDLSWNFIYEFPIALSPTIQRLYLDGNPKLFEHLPSNQLQISHLENMVSLSISANELKKLPSFGGSLPSVVEFDISNNPIEEITPDDLAFLCKLKYLHVDLEASNEICDCLKLEHWTTTFNIQVATFTCNHNGSTLMDYCDSIPSESTMKKREACLCIIENGKNFVWLMIGVFIVITILICIFVMSSCRVRKNRREETIGNQVTLM